MIWDSTLIMATIDVVVVLGALTVLYVSFRHRVTVLRVQVSRYVYSIAMGTCVIAALYLADICMMLILPLYTTDHAAMAAMRNLHLNWSWIAVLTGLSFIVAGLVPLLARLFPRIEGIIGSLEAEVVERKRAEARLQDEQDRLELRIEERTAELRGTNQRLVHEIAERSRSEKAMHEVRERLVNAQRIANLGNWDWNIVTGELHWSDQIYRIFGLEPQQFGATYEAFLQSVHPDDRAAVQAAVDRALNEKAPYTIDHRIVLPDGEERIVHEQGEVTFDASDKPLRMSGTVQDVTERKRAEAALRQSEKRYQAVVEDQPEMISRHSPDGARTFVNGAYCHFHGKSAEELIGRSAYEGMESSNLERLEALYVGLTPENPVGEFEISFSDPDGDEIWQRWTKRAIYDGSGQVSEYQAVGRDVTEQKRAESALRESEARFRDFAEGANDWIWEMDADFRYIHVSPAHEQHLGVPAEGVIGHTRPELYSRVLPQLGAQEIEHWQEFNRLLEAKQTFRSFEQKWVRPDGEVRYFLASGKPVFDTQGRFAGYRGVGSDITELKRRDEQLREELGRRVDERTRELQESEARLKAVLDNSPALIYLKDLEGRFIVAGKTARSWYGRESEEVLGTTSYDLTSKEKAEAYASLDREVIRTHRAATLEEEEVLHDGELHMIVVTKFPVFDPDGALVAIGGIDFDITERKRAEAALREGEERYRSLYDSIPLSVWEENWSQVKKLVDRLSDDGVTDWAAYFDSHPEEVKRAYDQRETLGLNPAGLEMYRTPSMGAVLELVTSTSLTADELSNFTGWLAAFARGETTFVTESRETRADGSAFDAHIRSHIPPEFVEDWGRVITTIEDITERKRLESELLRQERLATLGQLTATVSHELRNPLGVIRTSAYTLRNGLDSEAPYAGRALERVERSVVRCDRIIDEMLDFTRISSIEPEPTAIDNWLDEVLEEQALPPGVVLRCEFGLPDTNVSLDRDRLRRAVINVFDNACQAMLGEGEGPSADGEGVLTVHTRASAGRVEMVFEDRGPGIAPEIYERIFEPLFSTKGFGVGLGLPVVKQIMEQQGGGIEIETEVGRGTNVRLWLDPKADMKGAAA